MKSARGRLVVLAALVPLFAAAVASLHRPAFLQNLEYSTYDTLLRAARTRPPSGEIVIVDVDERSLSSIGQWPWRRDIIGELIAEIRGLGAKVVALDIVFAEPDRHEGRGIDPDAVLADTLRPGGVVLGYALRFDGAGDAPRACVRHPIGLVVVRREEEHPDPPFFRATGAICNLDVLTAAATASGFLNAAPDPDGLLRRVPLLAQLGDRVYPGLALAAVAAARQPSHMALHVANVNAASLVLGETNVPVDGKSNLLLRYRGPKRTFPYVSAVDVFTGDLPPHAFRNKIVFVGTTALGTREVVSTPLDTLFTGVEVQATVADNLLQRDFIRRWEHTVAAETVALLVLGLASVLAVRRFGAAWGALTVAGCVALAWAGSIWLISAEGTYLSPLFPTVGLIGAFGGMTSAALRVERHRADRASADKDSAQRMMIQALLSLTDIHDAETGQHSRRIQEYTRVLATALATHPSFRGYLTPERMELLATLGPLHDIGKVAVPDHLLKKPGPLTKEELVQVRRHPEHGRDAIANAEREAGVRDDTTLEVAKDIVYTHHEKWDGSGYPQGLRGTEIPVPGRVIAVVDVYDALRSDRPYHEPMTHDRAVDEIVGGRGTHFDPAVVDAFLTVSETLRRLSDAGRASRGSVRGQIPSRP